MQEILRTLGTYEPLVYLLLILGGIFPFRWLLKAWKEWREAYFGLEREIALRRLAKWIAACVLVLVLLCAEFAIATFIVPGMPGASFLSTPTLDILSTPNSTLSAAGQGSLALTTPALAAPAPGSDGCEPGKIDITSPKPGEEISGSVDILGVVSVPNFAFYKYEFASRGQQNWATISASRQVGEGGELGSWNTVALTPGDYMLRLVIVDTAGQSLPPCVIPVRIRGQ